MMIYFARLTQLKKSCQVEFVRQKNGKKVHYFSIFPTMNRAAGRRGGGHGPSSFLQLTLLQPGGQVMPTKLLPVPQILGLPPPLFYTGALQCLTLSIDPAGQCNAMCKAFLKFLEHIRWQIISIFRWFAYLATL